MKARSPFSLQYWLDRGYTAEEGEYERNSIRPIKKEYWMKKGLCEEEAEIKAREVKRDNSLRGNKASTSRSEEQYRKSSVRCVEHWLDKGFSEEEAKKKVQDIQSTFSLKKCIKKYGKEEGTKVWEQRQARWQESLNLKDDEEKQRINKDRASVCLRVYSNIDEAITSLNKTRKMSLTKDPTEFILKIVQDIQNNPYKARMSVEEYLTKFVPKIQLEIFETLSINYVQMVQDVIDKNIDKNNIAVRGKKQAYRLYTKEGLLRSSYEIYFYEQYKKLFPDRDILVDNTYPNSTFRYDFLVHDTFVEICPMYDTSEQYRTKMNHKVKTFSCVLLKDISEIDKFLQQLLISE